MASTPQSENDWRSSARVRSTAHPAGRTRSGNASVTETGSVDCFAQVSVCNNCLNFSWFRFHYSKQDRLRVHYYVTTNRWRLHKCRKRRMRMPRVRWRQRNCVCEPDLGMGYLVKLDSVERRKQRSFLKKHVTQGLYSITCFGKGVPCGMVV